LPGSRVELDSRQEGNVAGLALRLSGHEPDGLGADDVVAGGQFGQTLAHGFGIGLHAFQNQVAGGGPLFGQLCFVDWRPGSGGRDLFPSRLRSRQCGMVQCHQQSM
jgi:hypothetical protein